MRKIFYLLPFAALLIFSCGDNTNNDDVIGLSTKSTSFGSDAQSITITTEGDKWWIRSAILITGKDTSAFDFENSNINVLSDSYKLKTDDYLIDKKNPTTLSISMEENPSSLNRILNIGLFQENYVDNVTITQSGK